MKKEIIEDIVVLVLNLIVLAGITTVNVFYENIQVGNIYITYTSIVAALALIALLVLRNNSKLTLSLNIARIDLARLITILTFSSKTLRDRLSPWTFESTNILNI